MGTVVQYQQRGNDERNQRWERLERAELFARYSDLQTQGLSQRQAATALEVPRSTLQARSRRPVSRQLAAAAVWRPALALAGCWKAPAGGQRPGSGWRRQPVAKAVCMASTHSTTSQGARAVAMLPARSGCSDSTASAPGSPVRWWRRSQGAGAPALIMVIALAGWALQAWLCAAPLFLDVLQGFIGASLEGITRTAGEQEAKARHHHKEPQQLHGQGFLVSGMVRSQRLLRLSIWARGPTRRG